MTEIPESADVVTAIRDGLTRILRPKISHRWICRASTSAPRC